MFRIGGSRVLKLMKVPSITLGSSKIAFRQLFTSTNKVYLLTPATQSIRYFTDEVYSLVLFFYL